MQSYDAYCMIRRGPTLVPADIHAAEWLDHVPAGREILITATMPRHPEFHRWFMCLVGKVVDALGDPRYPTKDALLGALKMEVGHYTTIYQFDGTPVHSVKSISFASMGEDKFRRFVEIALLQLMLNFDVDPYALMDEVNREQGKVFKAKQPKVQAWEPKRRNLINC